MKKILFCGGSHMWQCKKNKLMEKKFNNFDLDFYTTAGPKNIEWSKSGGRYKVDGTIVSGNISYHNNGIDLSKYKHIVFIGQYIQIFRFCNFEKKQLFSKSLLEVMFNDDCFINLPENFYNEPLDLFPKLAPNRVILIPDPLVKSYRNEYIYFDFIDYFYEKLSLFCESKSIKLFMPDKSLLDDFRFTKEEYKIDTVHCNISYWEILFKKFNYI